jgi:uncharacterized protein (TIGR02996 family)
MNDKDEKKGFLKAIADDPNDDTRRLAYTDWLEEHGELGRAEFIRVQIALSTLPIDDAAARKPLIERQGKLLQQHQEQWIREDSPTLADIYENLSYHVKGSIWNQMHEKIEYNKRLAFQPFFRRGFLDEGLILNFPRSQYHMIQSLNYDEMVRALHSPDKETLNKEDNFIIGADNSFQLDRFIDASYEELIRQYTERRHTTSDKSPPQTLEEYRKTAKEGLGRLRRLHVARLSNASATDIAYAGYLKDLRVLMQMNSTTQA